LTRDTVAVNIAEIEEGRLAWLVEDVHNCVSQLETLARLQPVFTEAGS
jgi:hypothetical protein